jgi:hypothetical protein
MVDDARYLVCGFGVEALRRLVLALGGQLLKQGGRVSFGPIGVSGVRFLQSGTAKHRVCPHFLLYLESGQLPTEFVIAAIGAGCRNSLKRFSKLVTATRERRCEKLA